MSEPGRIIRVFPRRTKATPNDALAYVGPPDLFAEADEVHISVTFTYDRAIAEQLAEQWRWVAPVKLGGVAYGDTSLEFRPGMYVKPGYTITSRGCPRRCWFSVTGDTAIHTGNGWETVAEVKARLHAAVALVADGRVIVPIPFNEQVATPGGISNASHLIDEGERPVFRVSTKSGLTIKATADHPMLCVEGEELVWKQVQDIRPGDIAVVRAPEEVSATPVGLIPPVMSARSRSHLVHQTKIPATLTEDLAWLIGYIIGDGCLPMDGRPALHICVVPEHREKLERILLEQFGVRLRIYGHQKTDRIKHGWIHSRVVREFFVQTLGINPAEKLRVPQVIRRSPRLVIGGFLDGLWDADGYSPSGQQTSYVSTVSEMFAQEIALLLLSTGIVPAIHTINNDRIYKGGFCYRVARRYIDTIPSRRSIYRSPTSGNWHWRTKRSPQHASIARKTLRRSGLYHPLDREGWFYLPIKDVVLAGRERVYDLTVPGEECFVANGFVAHNCGVWKKWPTPNLLPIYDGWNILDDNLLACPREHVEAVFAMLRRQGRRVEFTGGLEALSLEDYQVDLLASLTPRPSMFFAYDPGDAFETLQSAARRLLDAGFTPQSHRLRCYVLIGFPRDDFSQAEHRLRQILGLGFTPMAMLWRPETPSQERHRPAPEWRAFQRRWARPAIIHAAAAA